MILWLVFFFHIAVGIDTPNILLVLADDQGWGDVGYNTNQYQDPSYDYKWKYNPPKTPNLDSMSRSDHSIVFQRFYAGSAVCSPTRSAILSGRTPTRECINGAEGCGTKPAWSCIDDMPFPPTTFTIAEAAKIAGYSTIHVGKWHLGEFFPKNNPKPSYAYKKWPVSHPGIHGFDEWHSTEASAPSSTTNCGCRKEWWESSPGCITGGGAWKEKAYACTNYWSPTDLDSHHKPNRPECHKATTSTLGCVANLTEKVKGDDSEYIMDVFEEFLARKTGSEKNPFLAVLWLHTNHEPHPSLPEYYHLYNDSFGDFAGDYLGTLTQMDSQIGRLREMLKTYGVANNTMFWFTADNGPHPGGRDKNKYPALSATNGLRQCKASLFEGGIREPGILEWPDQIKHNTETWFPAYVNDYLPTILELLNVSHQHPDWIADGMSLMSVIKDLAAGKNVTTRPSEHPLVFSLDAQSTIIDNEWKIIQNPKKGQCDMEPPYSESETDAATHYLFNLYSDPTESHDLKKTQPDRYATMLDALDKFHTSIDYSRQSESTCYAPGPPTPGPPGPTPPPTPRPPTPPSFLLKQSGKCLIAKAAEKHSFLQMGSCSSTESLAIWESDKTTGDIFLNGTGLCIKTDKSDCTAGAAIWLGPECNNDGFELNKETLVSNHCRKTGSCLASDGSKVMMDACSADDSKGWSDVTKQDLIESITTDLQ